MAEAVHARVRAMLPEPGSDDARRAAQRVEWCSTFFAEAPPDRRGHRQPCTTVVEGAWRALDDDERGRQFWACLQHTVSCSRDDPAAVAPRKRMKQLDADMHALYMRDGVRRD